MNVVLNADVQKAFTDGKQTLKKFLDRVEN